MWLMLAELLVVGYLPGAVLFRLPVADRPARAALPAEERVFWAVIVSVTLSCAVVLALAALGSYTFPRLIGVNTTMSAALAVLARGNLRLGPTAQGPRWSALIPMGLVAIGLWLYYPPSEYVIGGRDPGVYLNQGVQIAHRGSLVISDPLVAALPEPMHDLFFPIALGGYRSRFMGFSLLDAKRGEIVGQFPQAYPASLAIGYGIDGLRGALHTTGLWAMLGVLAVYFAGTWLIGRIAATAAATLLSLCLVQVWFARIPSSELALQALLFAGLLAFARMEHDRLRFLVPVAASLFGLLVFLRVEAWPVLAGVGAALALGAAVNRRTPAAFLFLLCAWTLAGIVYSMTVPRPYYNLVFGAVSDLTALQWTFLAVALGVGTSILALARRHTAAWSSRLPIGLVAGVLGMAIYAYFFREPGGRLAAFDAYALRTFTIHYLTPYVLAAALAGYAIAVPHVFWKSPLMVLLTTSFCVMFFYKTRIVPEHFWMARRFVPVILPAVFLFVGAAGFYKPWPNPRPRWTALGYVRVALAVLLVTAAGVHFVQQTRGIRPHVEYAGAVTKLEQLAARFGDEDLVLVESRGVSDVHVLALPLAYVYGRNVLVLRPISPDPVLLAEFLTWARPRYRDIFFVGGGGMDLLSAAVEVEPVGHDSFSLPEYERVLDRAPSGVREKAFEFGIHRLVAPPPLVDRFLLDVGSANDLYVRSFYPMESNGAIKYRWSGARSEAKVRIPAARLSTLTVWASNGRRPATALPAQMSVYLDNQWLGSVRVGVDGFLPYTFAIPAAERRVGSISVVRIETIAWSPKRELGVADERELGVMIQQVEVR